MKTIGGAAAPGARSSALLDTLVLFKANYNEGRDYLTNFEPFVADALRDWGSGEAVRPETLRDRLGERFSIPSMPINTAHVLEVRAIDHNWLHQSSSGFFPDFNALAEVPTLRPATNSLLEHLDELIRTLRLWARAAHSLDWSEVEASAALERFVEEFSFELAMAKRGGKELDSSTMSDDRALTVVNGFVRRAFNARDVATLNHLEEMVQGSMLANVLYFNDLGHWSENLGALTVYLDATVALRVLGVTLDPLAEATTEMMGLLRALGVEVRIFDHTVGEVHGVLVGVADSMRRMHRNVEDPLATSRMNREVSDALIQRGLKPADLDLIAANLDRRLRAAGVRPEPTLDVSGADVDVSQLKQLLRDGIHYKWETPLEKDVTSALAIHALRDGHEYHELGRTPAVFVTANPRLARLTQAFFKEGGVASAVPHVMTDVSLTTQVWIRRPAGHRDVPRRLLIAESHAALSQGPELWGKYLHEVQMQRHEGRIDDQEVKALVYAMESRESFFKVTHGDPDSVDEGTPLRVLDHLRTEIEDRANEEVKKISAEADEVVKERDALQVQAERHRAELARKQRELAGLEAWREDAEAREDRRRRLAGTAATSAAALAALALPLGGVVSGAIQASLISSALLVAAVGSYAWGHRKGGRWMLSALLVAGTLLAIPVGIKAVFFDGGDAVERAAPRSSRSPAPGAQGAGVSSGLPGAGRSKGSR